MELYELAGGANAKSSHLFNLWNDCVILICVPLVYRYDMFLQI